MKKGLFVFVVIISMVITSCAAMASLPSQLVVYQQPVSITETTVVVGSGLEYSTARNAAIKKALDEGYSKIIAESIGQNSMSGLVNVTLIMIK